MVIGLNEGLYFREWAQMVIVGKNKVSTSGIDYNGVGSCCSICFIPDLVIQY
jgi:hypothetical protein